MTESAADSVILAWAAPDQLEAAARFLAAAVRADDRYVSHGEVQTGLSPDGERWAPDLEALMVEDFKDLGPDRAVLLAHVDGRLAGVAVILRHADDRARYVVVEDVAVAPEARAAGVGGRMMDAIEADARASGADWAFLESGLDNDDAHRFFERRAYRPLSKVFAKRL